MNRTISILYNTLILRKLIGFHNNYKHTDEHILIFHCINDSTYIHLITHIHYYIDISIALVMGLVVIHIYVYRQSFIITLAPPTSPMSFLQ